MTDSVPAAQRLPARERLLRAASELFYEEGVNTVGIDRVIERAGVAKATLYSAFGSKDGLIRAYLESRHEARRERVAKHLARHRDPRAKLLSVFDSLDESITDGHYHGCAFVNASVEAQPKSGAVYASDAYRTWFHELLTGLAADAGAGDPDGLAGRLTLLYDGAGIAARMDGDKHAAARAKAAAAALVDAELTRAPGDRAY